MRRRIPIRAKVAGVSALPLVSLGTVVALCVSAASSSAESVTRQARVVRSSAGYAELVDALQDERNMALLDVLDLGDALALGASDAAAARARTDAAAGGLRHQGSAPGDGRDDDTALAALGYLPALRGQADAARGTGPERREAAHTVFTGYSSLLATLDQAREPSPPALSDATIRQGVDLVIIGAHAADVTAQLVEQLVYVGTGPGGVDQLGEAAGIAQLRQDVARDHLEAQARGRGPYHAAAAALAGDPHVRDLDATVDRLIAGPAAVDPRAVLAGAPLGPDGAHARFGRDVAAVLDRRVADLRAESDARRRLLVGGAGALAAAALVVAWLIGRSISRPLRDLSTKARSVATHRLPVALEEILDTTPGGDLVVPVPEPIRVRARDETADVAQAFNEVQDSAIGLAAEQAALRRNVAVSYVNLGHRTQNLLSRLLDVVADLERGEDDAGRLAKIHKLDHLATRIRRNAASLLVLSEAAPSTPWRPPVEVGDVVGAALGEVEDYARVRLRTLDPVMVLGRAAGDLAHLLAELIENALRYSPPGELVEVVGAARPDGYRITVVDHGVGMSPDEIDLTNRRLAGTESFTVTPARHLGHYVTAVLAARHGIQVRLRGSVVVGTAAVVDLPPALTTDAPVDQPEVLPPEPAPPPSPPATSGPDRPARRHAAVAAPPPGAGGDPPDAAVAALRAVAGEDQPDASLRRVPTAEDVRLAVEILQARPSPTRPPPTSRNGDHATTTGTAVGEAPGAHPNGAHVTEVTDTPAPLPGRPARWPTTPPPGSIPPPAGSPATGSQGRPGPPPDGVPGRTASGLVRGIQGTRAPAAPPLVGATPSAPDATAGRDEASSVPVDGEGIMRFLTDLTLGVQRSLDEWSATARPGEA